MRDGKILRVFKPSENLSSTAVRPFMNDIFSSRVLDAKVDRSRKLSVEIEREEKKAWDGRADGPGRLCGWRVINEFKRSITLWSASE